MTVPFSGGLYLVGAVSGNVSETFLKIGLRLLMGVRLKEVGDRLRRLFNNPNKLSIHIK